MSNAIWVYNASARINGTVREIGVGTTHIDHEAHGIGTRSFLRELLRKELGASSVRIGNRVGTMAPATASSKGVTVIKATKANIALAKSLRDGRATQAQERKAAKVTTTPDLPGVAIITPTREVSETQRIRTWAKANGHKVADKGRLPQTVVNAYHKAHAPANEATEVHAEITLDALKGLKKKELRKLLLTLLTD